MPRPALNITGQTFGKLTAIKRGFKTRAGRYKWFFQCDCGNITQLNPYHVSSGQTESCGCLHSAKLSARNTIHNLLGTEEHRTWISMIQRCADKCNPYYGGRGITVCEQWKTFTNFLADMGEKPTIHHTIDRKDGNGNYEPDNCRWATKKEQRANQL